jgi:hypothetical protein
MRMLRRFAVSVSAIALSLFAFPILAFAAGLPGQIVPASCSGPGGCQSICDIASLAQNLLNTGIYIAVFLSAVLFAWAGWEAVTAGGSAEKVGHAKGIFGNVVIGLVIILAGWLVVDTLMKTLTKGDFGPWNNVCKTAEAPSGHFYA